MKNLRRLIILASLLLVAAGCSKKQENATAGAGSGADATPGAAPIAGARVVEITANDTMKFSVTEIRAKRGEALAVKLSNVGQAPKFSMGHNWALLKKSANIDAFITDAMNAAATDYIPASHQGDMIAHTKLLGPKESDTATFLAPAEAGRYPFLCTFPGHYQVGMKGDLVVE